MRTSVFSQVSIDGKLTLGPGQSSKPLFSFFDGRDMEFIHKFRGKVDGIMVGKNTIVTDDPFLTNRHEENKNPVRIVPTRAMDIPMDSHVLTDEGRTIVVTTENGKDEEKVKLLRERGKECLVCGQSEVDFPQLFRRLEAEYGISTLMVEGGGFLNWHMFKQDLVDEIILMQIPIIIGGSSNITLVDGEGYNKLDYAKRFKVAEVLPKDNYTLLRYLKAV
ncbi:riboflavin biosynthesis protein RibD [Paenibacillus macerans]|uniref:Riboflavin biosynthesis protein RibD n=1 Tax=Paenibacillus macerans TaxID=44252 RepID=A0A6N8F476_PAEMA|nr:dihydrofolate reductase family protein [Paenibacillus macerans]MDU5946798.1 dihydrofolate reductase family protein [Paenibacillus macerans]MEC0332800.1 dihydrofolate reductase family protein [Paenibacillus macerans]MED4956839.1 dihydrofolate reductase family protein [Paenibacillus macerans]MUG25272.1 riboflavin biosynthesis protein RibD [Paenibacillus macerans]UMV49397.1 dihydrofolate reductase family protein [Paenibacillus macerans]